MVWGWHRRRIFVFTLLLLGMMCCCAAALAQEKVIKIGALFPLTGPAALSGQNCLAAVKMAAELINEAHDIADFPLARQKGLLGGYRIEIVPADHRGRADFAKLEAERLFKQEGVFAIVGSYHSAASKSASAVAEEMERIFMCGASSSAALTERNFRYFFRTAATDTIESQEFIDYIGYLNEECGAGIKTLGLIYENSEFGRHAAEKAKEEALKVGLEVVADISFMIGTSNMNNEVQKLKNANPDALFGAALGNDYSLWVRTMKQVNWTPKIIINYCTGYQNPAIVEELGDDANYQMGGMGYSPELAERHMTSALEAQKIYRKYTGLPLDSDAIQEAVCLHVLAQAIERAGVLDTEKVAGILRSETFRSPMSLSGQVAFDYPGGQNNKAFTVITQIVDGEYRTVFPKRYADFEAVYPIPAWERRR